MHKQNQIESKTIYKGHIFTLTHDTMELYDGRRYPRDVVHHHGGVGIVVVRNDKILLVKQYRYAVQEETLEIPAGKLEKGEDPYACALRELEEESGFGSSKLELVCEMYSTPGFCTEKLYIYEAKNLSKLKHPRPMDEDEEIEAIWMPLDEAYHKIQTKEIRDAKTILAIQHALLNRR